MKNENSLQEVSLLLSIIIPVFNRQNGLNALLFDLSKAIIAGEFQSMVEIVVIDDGSSPSITLESLENSPFPVVFERNKKNMGAPFSREKGFGLSKGRFVHFHDSDDTVTDVWLQQIICKLQRTPDVDILTTARIEKNIGPDTYRYQKYYHKQVLHPERVQSRLVYRNCMGPLGGVTFSRHVLKGIKFKRFASCQDWQMYLEVIERSKVLLSCLDIVYIFNKTGSDRISHNPRKKILGHLQLARITAKQSIFHRNIRLFYLYSCRSHVLNKRGGILNLYYKNRVAILLYFSMVSIYWRFF